MPLPAYNFGFNLQWQFNDKWYVMADASAGTASGGESPKDPWTDWDWRIREVTMGWGSALSGASPRPVQQLSSTRTNLPSRRPMCFNSPPLAKLQSDFQTVWNPAYNAAANHAFVFQVQLAFGW